MVEIVEEPYDENEDVGASSSSSSRQQPQQPTNVIPITTYASQHPVACLMFVARLATFVCAVSFAFPFLSILDPLSAYYKAISAAAATFSLRLRERIGEGFAFNREFLARLITEDALHYLIFSLIFMFTNPVSIVLIPITLYAILHATSFFIKAMRETGRGNQPIVGLAQQMLDGRTPMFLSTIAVTELFILPLLVTLIFLGKMTFVTPFIYYRFLTLRYASRRNPYFREVMHSLRFTVEQKIQSPSCPTVVRNFAQKSIAFISTLAPPS